MDEDRHTALIQTVDTERILLKRLVDVNRRFHDVLGTAASRHQLDHEAREAQDAELHALAEQAHILHEELLSVHRAYLEAFPREVAAVSENSR